MYFVNFFGESMIDNFIKEMIFLQDVNKIPLVSSEIFGLWNSYMNDSMAICLLKHFLNNTDDIDIRPVVQQALDISTNHIPVLIDFFNQEELPIPEGFSEDKDLNLNAPRLFNDSFYLIHLSFMARVGMERYSQILGYIARKDLRDYYTKCISESTDLYNRLTDRRLSKGLYIRSPHVEVVNSVQYIESKSFMLDWFGEKRPMLTREIYHIFVRMLSNIVGRAVTTAFGQVSKIDKVVEYMFEGKDMTSKRIETFSNILTKEEIPIPATSESYVTDSTTAPFSEKLMMFHIVALAATAISDLGTALADTFRSDIQTTYLRLLPETLKYSASGANIMIKNGWLEQPPQVINHENLAKG
jgi:hypothetical protein